MLRNYLKPRMEEEGRTSETGQEPEVATGPLPDTGIRVKYLSDIRSLQTGVYADVICQVRFLKEVRGGGRSG